MTKMKAVRIHEYGNSDVLKLEDVEIPKPGSDEVLVKINYAGVNPFDWKVREGFTKNWIQLKFPAILGIDFAGTIEETGPGVSKFREGDKVFGRAEFTKGGSYAEYTLVKEKAIAHVPKSIPINETAGLPVVAGTAWAALFDIAKLSSGKRVLITGASGGVGQAAVQIAKSAEAYVIGTTSKANIDLVKSIGADEVIDYTEGDFSKKVTQPVDIVFDTVGGETFSKSYGLVKKGGILVTTAGQPDEELAKKHGITASGLNAQTDGKRLEEIARLVDSGKLKVVIEKEFGLSEIKAAHDLSQSGKARGKIIIKIS